MAKDVITPYIKKNTSPQDRTREGAIRGDEAMPEEPEAPPVAAPASRKTGSPEFNAAFGAARKAGDDTFEFRGKTYQTTLEKSKSVSGGLPPLARQEEVPDLPPYRTVNMGRRGTEEKPPFETDLEKAHAKRMLTGAGIAATLMPFAKGVSAAKAEAPIAQRLREAAKVEGTPEGFAKLPLMERARATGGYKKGGSIRGGGIESRGKTKGRFV